MLRKMSNTLVSIIIPIYNAEETLVECIDSVLKQTYNNIEIILINDGSNDRSGLICEELKAKDDRIKLIHQKNSGPSTARNVGVLSSKGLYLQFVDADDHIDLKMVETLLSVYENEVDLVLCGYYNNSIKSKEFIPDNEGSYTLTEFVGFFSELFKKTLIHSPGNKLYRASIIKDNDIEFSVKNKHGEDLMFNIEYLQHCKEVSLIKRPLYYYDTLINPLSLTKKYKENYFENRKKVFYSLKKFLENFTDEFPPLKEFLDQVYSNYIITTIANLFHEENNMNSKEKRQEILKIIEDKFVRNNIDKIEKNRKRGVFTRFLLKYKLSSVISFYFNIRLIIKRNSK